MSQLIKAIIFDYGMVLSLPQLAEPVRRMEQLTGLDSDTFASIYWKHRLAYDRADLTGVEYWNYFGDVSARLDEIIAADSESWNGLHLSMVEWARSFRPAGYKAAILSNIPLETRDYVRRQNPWFEEFNHLTFSCDLNLVKPEAGIYEECLAGLGTAAGETIFIDDRPANVAAAAKLGLHAIEHTSEETTRAEVERLLRK